MRRSWQGLLLGVCVTVGLGSARAQWTAPVTVSGDVAIDGGQGQLATSVGGNVTLVWERTAGGAVLSARSSDRGATWDTTRELIPYPDSSSQGAPSIASDITSGTVLATWQTDNFDGNPEATIARTAPGLPGFPTVASVGLSNLYFGMALPVIASGGNDHWIVAGVSGNNPLTDEAILLFQSINNGQNWLPVANLGRESAGIRFDRNMDIASDGQGGYVLVTESRVDSVISPSDILTRFSRSATGETWTDLANLDGATPQGTRPRVASAGVGRYMVLLSRGAGPGNLLAYSSSDGGATWNAAVPVNGTGINASSDLSGHDISVDEDGNAVAVWSAQDPSGTRKRLYFSTSRDFGITWSPTDALTTPTADASDEYPVVQYDGQGRWAAAWQRRSFGTSITLSMESSNLIFPIRADLSVFQSDDPDPATVGDQITYKITVRNDGPSSATGVRMVDTTPLNSGVISVTQTQGSRTETTGSITFDFGDLNEGATASAEVSVLVNEYGVYKNIAEVTADQEDTDYQDRVSTETTKVLVDGIELTGEWEQFIVDVARRPYKGKLKVDSKFLVQNLGNERARGFKILLMLSNDEILSDDDAFIGVLNVPHLGPGNERNLRWETKLRRYTPWQGKKVLAIIDAELRVDEVDEFNNTIATEELPAPPMVP